MIWFCLIIPVITVPTLLCLWHKKILWWEYLLIFFVPLLFIALSKSACEFAQTRDAEYLGGFGTSATYYEDWNEYVHKTCSREDCTGSGENRSCTTEYYDCSYVEEHPAYWQLDSTLGDFSISQFTYKRLVGQFKNEAFVELNRRYHTNDGDKYVTKWDGDPLRIEPVTRTHSYENRVQVSNSVFKFPDVDPKGLIPYPPVDGYAQNCVLGVQVKAKDVAERRLAFLNATLGAKSQIRVFILLFKNVPLQTAMNQRALWKGGNKNELVILLSVDDAQNVQWADVFSWSEAENLKVAARSKLMESQPLDLPSYIDWLGPEIRLKWRRRHFREFSYLSVQPPLWYIVVAFLIVLLLCIGISWWVIHNEHETRRS